MYVGRVKSVLPLRESLWYTHGTDIQTGRGHHADALYAVDMVSIENYTALLEPIDCTSADADDTRTMVPHAKSTIVLYTELHVYGDQQLAIGRRLRIQRTRYVCRVAARCYQHQTDHCRCLYRTCRQSVCRGEIFQVQTLGQSSRGKYLYFCRYPNFTKTQRSIGRRKPACKKIIYRVVHVKWSQLQFCW